MTETGRTAVRRIAYGGDGLPARARVLAVLPMDESDVDEGTPLLLVEPA